MINRVILIGRLCTDVELRYTGSGVGVASFRIAVNRPFMNNGKRETDFISVVSWRQLAENCANHLKKGQQVGIDGRLQTRSYEGKDGKTVHVVEVVADSVMFLDHKGSQKNKPDDPFANVSESVDITDDLPFDSTDDGLPEVELDMNKVSNNRRRFRHGTGA